MTSYGVIHQGRNVRRLREILGIKQETIKCWKRGIVELLMILQIKK